MCFFIQSCEPLGEKKTKNTKKSTKKKSTSFFHEPCVLPASPSSPSPHFSTDRNLTVANLHVLATQINIAVLISLLGLGKVLPPTSFPLLKSWHPLCHCLGCTSQPLCSVVILTKCRAPPGPPCEVWWGVSLGWAVTLSLSNCKRNQPSAA